MASRIALRSEWLAPVGATAGVGLVLGYRQGMAVVKVLEWIVDSYD